MDIIVDRIEHAAQGGKSVTFVTGDEPVTVSWADFHIEAKRVAARLQGLGVSRGDRVAVLGPTTRNLVSSFQAIWLCGATLVVLPLPMRMGSLDEFTSSTKARVRNAGCSLVLVDSQLMPFIEAEAGDPPIHELDSLTADAQDEATPESFVRPNYEPDDLFILQFTSGSTSEPKGVMLPHKMVAANLDAIMEGGEIVTETEVLVSWLPLYHDMGLIGFCVLPMAMGLDLVLGAPQDFLASPGRWMEWLSTYGGTATAGPNFSYVLATRALRRTGASYDLSALRVALNGAEPVDPQSVRNFVEAGALHGMRPGAVFPAFGMAEVAIAGSFPKPLSGLSTDVVDADAIESDHRAIEVDAANPKARELVRLGKPVPGLEFRVADPNTGQVLNDREVGELQIRGTSVTPGYYNRPEENEKLFDGEWLKTGDLAYLVDGEMVMCGRIKDLIIVGGRNVHPQDIERAIGEVEGIRAGNVIAFSEIGRNGKEKVVVVAETRQAEDLEALKTLVSERSIEAVGVPCRDVALVKPSTLPKTSSGKLQRSLCRQQYVEGSLQLA